MRRARRGRASDLPDRPRRRRAVPVAARGGRRRPEAPRADPHRAGGGRLRRRRAEIQGSSSPRTSRRCCCACPQTGAGRRCSTSLDGPLHEAVIGMRELHALLAPRWRRASSSTSGWCAASATTPARSSRSTTRPWGPDRQRRALRRAARALRPAAPGGRLRAQRRAAAHRADGRGAGPERFAWSGLRIAVPARRAVRRTRSTCSTGSGSTPARCARTIASCYSSRWGS